MTDDRNDQAVPPPVPPAPPPLAESAPPPLAPPLPPAPAPLPPAPAAADAASRSSAGPCRREAAALGLDHRSCSWRSALIVLAILYFTGATLDRSPAL